MTDPVNNSFVDQPSQQIRPGEELDRPRLEQYLRGHLDEFDGKLEIYQFPAGYSNLTYLLKSRSAELILRRPPFGNRVKSAHDMSREYQVLSKLSPAYSLAPRPLHYCDDESVIGSPFYLMERQHGIILRRPLPPRLHVSPQQLRKLSKSFADRFAELHSLDYQQLGLGELGRPDGYIERQVKGWTKRYEKAATHNYPDVDHLATWLESNQPSDSSASLIHNDFKFDNLVLGEDDVSRIVAVLDWEMSTLGDPLMDLGSSLAYWVDADDPDDLKNWAFAVTDRPGCLNRQQLAERYLERRNCKTDHLQFFYAYGLFKLIGIVQQIYARFHRGSTKDERFASLHHMVAALARQARRAIEGSC